MGLQTLSGKVKKIQKKEFIDMFSKGEFYPPEGCTIFSIENCPVFYCYGGARAAKPGHWNMSNFLFQIQTNKLDPSDNTAHDISSFKMYNHTVSKTSQFTKLFAASGLTEMCSSDHLLGFTVNGKDLDCPNEKLFLSNEIRVFETVSETTFRSVIIRTEEEDNINLSKLKRSETFQTGDIPEPSYGSSLVRIPQLDSFGAKVAVKIGGAVLSNRKCSDLELLFSKSKIWEEASSSEVHTLKYNVEDRLFEWKVMKVKNLEPRAFHSAVVVDRFVYIFGGLDIKTNKRYPALPVRININDWSVSHVVSEGLVGFLSGAASLPCADKVYLVGGYKEELAKGADTPCDIISEVSFSSQGNYFKL